MFNLRPLFSVEFWFASHPEALRPASVYVLLAIFLLMIVAAFVLSRRARRQSLDRYAKRTVARVRSLLTTMGFLGLVWLFFAFEAITFFQARYWFLIWLFAVVVWKGAILYEKYRVMPRERLERNEAIEKLKYLPGRGK